MEGPRHSPYLSNALTDQQRLVTDAHECLKGVEFEGFIGMGLSGSMVAPLLAYVMGKRFAIVRKRASARSHSATAHGIESNLKPGDRWLFCDDFISSGETRKTVIDRIRDHHVGAVEYAGDYLYAAGGYSTTHLRRIDLREGNMGPLEEQQVEFKQMYIDKLRDGM